MLNLGLYMAQRLSAMAMGPLVVGHLIVMVVAIQGGLTTGEILSRTRGSIGWFLFYGCFVVAVSIHAAIGLRVIVHETSGLRGAWLEAFTWATGIILLTMGARAVMAVTLL
ncbi:succinate dehydrogenase [Pseudogemmobacter sonorensis]|uniref:succinate dehydrogenase n=1 Tax=Pseudogemmobacter sonorensis TaxID=2989681 RepID=UPI003685A6D2